MKLWMVVAVLGLVLPAAAWAEVDSAKVGSSIEDFKSVVAAQGGDPHVVAELAVLALVVYQRDEDLARTMFSLLVEPDDVTPDGKSPTGYTVVRHVADDLARTRGKENIARGYCGGTPGKRYEDADTTNCTVTFDTQYSSTRQGVNFPTEGRAKFFVANGGGSRPRPIELILIDGKWKLRNWGGLLTGVNKPAE